MKILLLGFLLCGGALFANRLLAGSQIPVTRTSSEENVNSRYVIESVEVTGEQPKALTTAMQNALRNLVGERFNSEELDSLARQIRKDLHLKAVSTHLVRGSQPDQVKVMFEMTRRSIGFDLSVPKFLYHSKQGWSAQMDASTTIKHNTFTFGMVSDGDELAERFAGINTRYENTRLGTDRVHFQFDFEDYHEQWNRSTLLAMSRPAPGNDALAIYRSRQNFQPAFTFLLTPPLTLTVGASFERIEPQFTPSGPASRTESANAMITTLRYHRRLEDSGALPREIDAAYSLRAASRSFGGVFGYTRHRLGGVYRVSHNKHSVSDEVTAGYIAGQAPLYERFVLGTSSLLRGWNRYEIDPLGGNRMIHNSVTYGYRFSEGVGEIFYDAGALWSRGQTHTARHSLGIGYRQSIFSVAMAFPVREGNIVPVFMVGMNY